MNEVMNSVNNVIMDNFHKTVYFLYYVFSFREQV